MSEVGDSPASVPFGHYRVDGRLVPSEYTAQQAVRTLLRYIGEDPDREGLKETPQRYLKALSQYCSGVGREDEARALLKTFGDGASGYDEMIVESSIPFYSHCEHHLAPFFGSVSVAYIPSGRIVGLSKIPRLIEIYSRRLQVQERLTVQIADALMGDPSWPGLHPKGVGVIVEARHFCMECRGVQKPNVMTRTSALRGVFLSQPEVRSEFLALCGK